MGEYLSTEDYKIAEDNGISKEHADIRFYQLKWSKEKSITHTKEKQASPKLAKKQTKKPKDRVPPLLNNKQISIARYHGLSTWTIKARIKKGIPIDEAITMPLSTRWKKKKEKPPQSVEPIIKAELGGDRPFKKHVYLAKFKFTQNPNVTGKDKVCDLRLKNRKDTIAAPYRDGEVLFRVNIPEDLEQTKHNTWYITDDQRTLDELGYDILIWTKKTRKWKEHNEFKGTRLGDIRLL